jgi:hypothetical protein
MDASDGPAATFPNILVNGSFEPGCNDWRLINGTLAENATARTGAGSCAFCGLGGGTAYMIQDVPTDVPAGSEWFAEIWARTLDGAGVPASSELQVFSPEPDGGGTIGTTSSGPPLDTTWQIVTATMRSTTENGKMEVQMRIEGGGAECVLVDDAKLYRKK